MALKMKTYCSSGLNIGFTEQTKILERWKIDFALCPNTSFDMRPVSLMSLAYIQPGSRRNLTSATYIGEAFYYTPALPEWHTVQAFVQGLFELYKKQCKFYRELWSASK